MPPSPSKKTRSPTSPPPSSIVHVDQYVRTPSNKLPASKGGGLSKKPAFSGPPMYSRLLVEFLGTALLTLTVAAAAGQGSALAPFAIGTTLICAIYAGGHVSGAHYNPAVTLAILVRGKIDLPAGLAYMVVQLLGGAAGGAAAILLEPSWAAAAAQGIGLTWPGTPAEVAIGYAKLGDGVSVGSALLAEAVVTFALCHVVLHTATNADQDGNSYFGLAIGLVVLSGAISVGSISGGAFNPAVRECSGRRSPSLWRPSHLLPTAAPCAATHVPCAMRHRRSSALLLAPSPCITFSHPSARRSRYGANRSMASCAAAGRSQVAMLALVRLTSRAALSAGFRGELLAFGMAIASETWIHLGAQSHAWGSIRPYPPLLACPHARSLPAFPPSPATRPVTSHVRPVPPHSGAICRGAPRRLALPIDAPRAVW